LILSRAHERLRVSSHHGLRSAPWGINFKTDVQYHHTVKKTETQLRAHVQLNPGDVCGAALSSLCTTNHAGMLAVHRFVIDPTFEGQEVFVPTSGTTNSIANKWHNIALPRTQQATLLMTRAWRPETGGISPRYTNIIHYRRMPPITVKPVFYSGTLINSAVANCLFKQQ
jgi:hypothetical protein